MEVDVTLINIVNDALQEFEVENLKTVLRELVVQKGVLILKFNTTHDVKQVVNRICSYLESNYDKFKADIHVNGKIYKLRYPSYYTIFKQSYFVEQLGHPFYWGILVAFVPLIITALCFKFLNISIERLDEAAKQISDYYVNICFLLSTLIITFLITKVVAIKQEKNSRVEAIRNYSNQLTEFRRICRNILTDPSLFTNQGFHRYASSIKGSITFQEVEGWHSTKDKNLKRKVDKLIYKSDYSEIMLKFYLQLQGFYLDGGYNPLYILATHSDNHIYTSDELKQWQSFKDLNLIWYVFDNERGIYNNEFNFINQAYGKPVINSAKRFNRKKYKNAKYDSELLLEISIDVQNVVLPNLISLVEKNESGLPFVFKYFIGCFSVIVVFGVVVKNLFDLFYPVPFIDLLSILVTIMVLVHIFVSLKYILGDELNI